MSGFGQVLLYAGWALIALGLALAAAPRLFTGLGSPAQPAFEWLNRRYFVERFVYRHHRPFGAFVALGALYAGIRLGLGGVPADPDPWTSLWLIAAIRFLQVSSAALLLVGLVILFRPSLLKGVEQWANRWMSLRPRLVGVSLLLVGSYVIVFMLFG